MGQREEERINTSLTLRSFISRVRENFKMAPLPLIVSIISPAINNVVILKIPVSFSALSNQVLCTSQH